MLIVLVVKGLEHVFKVKVLLDYNNFQLIIISNGYAKVVANKAKIYYFKFAAELLFKRINGSSTADNLDIIYIN